MKAVKNIEKIKISLFLYFAISHSLIAQNLFFEKLTVRDIRPSTQIHGITKDSTGYMWFGSWNGAYRYDGKTFDFYYHNPNDNSSLPSNRIRSIISDRKLGLWFFTFDRKFAKFDYGLNSFNVIDSAKVPQQIIRSLIESTNIQNKKKTSEGKSYSIDSHLFTIKDLKTGKVSQYTSNINLPGQLSDDYITDFFVDEDNIIWLGTRGGDVYKANPNRNPFELYYSFRKGSKNAQLTIVKAILKADDKIWLGTDEGILIYSASGLDLENPYYKSNSTIKYVRSFYKDKNGGIWIGSTTGLEYYNPKTNQAKTIISQALYPNLLTWSVYTLESFGNNYLWVGLYNGMARINLDSRRVQFYDIGNMLKGNSVMDILTISETELWLATEGNGIVQVKLDNKNTFRQILQLNSFQTDPRYAISEDLIYSLHKDRNGKIWAGTTEGLLKIDPAAKPIRVEKINLFSETANTYISSITEDRFGNVWIAHKQGISKIELKSNKISHYQREDRFGSWSFSERAVYNDYKNDKLYFGDKNGYVAFSPSDIKTIENNDNLVFKALYLNNDKVAPMASVNGQIVLSKDLSQMREVHLNHENTSFTVELASLNFNRTSKVVFEYMLDGLDDQWIKTEGSRITYTKIPPGNYILKARIISSDDSKSPIKTLHFNIGAPWYETWTFKIMLLTVALTAAFLIIREILYRERLKNEIRLAAFNTEKQQELNQEKIDFFTNISHNLKTPLTLITDPLKQIEGNELPAEERSLYFSIVNRNVDYLTRLIHQILDFRKSETGKLKLNLEIRDFNAFIRENCSAFGYIAEKRNINFKIEADDSPLYCEMDYEKVDQILQNVISNALKYTPDGGSVLYKAGLNVSKTGIEIFVQDNGIGISSEALEKVFEPFNNSGPAPFHGYSTGIGLSLSKKMIEFINGSIAIESIQGQGTAVCITLPYTKSDDIQAAASARSAPAAGSPAAINETAEETSRQTILIVEDNPDVQTYLQNELKKEYNVLQEYDGQKGLDTAVQYIPDIIISDVMMPEKEGTELCRELKLIENTCHIPIILLTAKSSDENKIGGFDLGAEAYVTKPFSIIVLKAQIKSILENRKLLSSRLGQINSIQELQEESPNLDKIFIQKTVDIIVEHMEEINFNPEMLAHELRISQRQLYRKIKAVSGCTVHEFMTKTKMNQAEALLKNSDLSISQIAYKLGYSEVSNFSRTFSKHFGCSPSQFNK